MSFSRKVSVSRRNLLAAAAIVVGTGVTGGSVSAQVAGGSPAKPAGPGGPSTLVPFDGERSRRRPKCFLRGTLIMTPVGERPIETFAAGDLVVTRTGAVEPIKWIGRRSIGFDASGQWSALSMPIKIARSAFGHQLPHTDLYVSPSHSVYADGVLVPAGDLVNGLTIVPAVPAGTTSLDYFHIELAAHDVILAANLPVETLDVRADTPQAFDNAADRPMVAVADHTSYAPIVCLVGRRSAINSRLRSALAPWIDRRLPFDRVRDHVEERAIALRAAA